MFPISPSFKIVIFSLEDKLIKEGFKVNGFVNGLDFGWNKLFNVACLLFDFIDKRVKFIFG